MRQLLEPRLVNDDFGDPCLYVDCRDQRRALLFDPGDIRALPPRKLLRVSHVFVSHAHMDHFAGFDHLLRVVLGCKSGIVMCGGPGFVDRVEHKLRANIRATHARIRRVGQVGQRSPHAHRRSIEAAAIEQHDAAFVGQSATHAAVDAETEGHVLARPGAVDDEALDMLDRGFIAVAR